MKKDLSPIELLTFSSCNHCLLVTHILNCVLNKEKRRDVAARELELIYQEQKANELLFGNFTQEEINQLSSSDCLRDMPQRVVGFFKAAYKQLEENNQLSYEKLRSVCERINQFSWAPSLLAHENPKMKLPPREEDSNQTFVLSIKMDTGIYIHLKIGADATFQQLHSAILDSFHFDDDHAHVFFFGRPWVDDEASLYSDFIDDAPHHTSEFLLGEILKQGQAFTYIFDFGDEWTFKCKVLKVLDESFEDYKVIKSVGTPHPQYRDWDEEEDD